MSWKRAAVCWSHLGRLNFGRAAARCGQKATTRLSFVPGLSRARVKRKEWLLDFKGKNPLLLALDWRAYYSVFNFRYVSPVGMRLVVWSPWERHGKTPRLLHLAKLRSALTTPRAAVDYPGNVGWDRGKRQNISRSDQNTQIFGFDELPCILITSDVAKYVQELKGPHLQPQRCIPQRLWFLSLGKPAATNSFDFTHRNHQNSRC